MSGAAFDEEVGYEVNLPAQDGDNDFEYADDSTADTSYELDPLVRNFIVYFHRNVLEQNVADIASLYESSWNKLTDRFYQSSPWPPASVIAPIVNNDPIFLILYKELFYRHIYAKLQPTLEQRFESFENYCDLFNYILNYNGPVQLELPNQWLWDIIDEFIYQFQVFCQFRSRLKGKTDEELEKLKANPQIWNVHSVLNVLHSLAEKSNIQEQLRVAKNGGDMSEVAGEFGSRPLYKMFGYFSVIGLLRLHCLLGDYYLALRMMDNIELHKKGLFTRVTACHITTFYYVGFAYVMMRRYRDAASAFSHILYFISSTKQYHTRSYQYDQFLKMTDQMYSLLAICVSLCPQRIEETVEAGVRERHGEKIDKILQGGDESNFEEWFMFACPKFISPCPPNYDSNLTHNFDKEPLRHQLKLFLREVKEQLLIPTIRSYLKLYTTMSVPKLASFLKMPEDQFRSLLMSYKHKTRTMTWVKGTLTEGEFSSQSDFNFYVSEDLIHIAESKLARRYADFFIRHVNKFEDIIQLSTQ